MMKDELGMMNEADPNLKSLIGVRSSKFKEVNKNE